jgi:CspA family cold shock protein
MTVGTVEWFDDSKGLGLIRAESGAEVLVHFSEIRCDGYRTLSPGERVEFEIRETERGQQAANVNRH